MSEITQEQLKVEFNKLVELRQKTENLAEALLEHITKFDDRADAFMTQFEIRVDRTIDERVEVKVNELLSKRAPEASPSTDA